MVANKKNGRGSNVVPVHAPAREEHAVSGESLAELVELNKVQSAAENELVGLTMQRFQVEHAQAQAATKVAQAAEAYKARVIAAAKAKGLDLEKKGWKFHLDRGMFTEG